MISRDDFPLLTSNPNLIYLDNAATTQKPNAMLQALTHYYMTSNANVGRGAYSLATTSQEHLENSRKTISDFFQGNNKSLVFTSGATESLNLSAKIASNDLEAGDVIVLTIWDHHANILPWQEIAKTKNLKIKYIENIDDIYNPSQLKQSFWNKVKVLSMPHIPNTIGNIFPVDLWVKEAKKHNVITVIDGAQAVSSMDININDIGADFYAFSAHKLYGPMGLGCLFIDNKFSEKQPMILGGGIVEDVFLEQYILKEGTDKFEAGTPDVANAYAFAQTLLWLKENQWENNLTAIKKYNESLLMQIKENSEIKILNHLNYPHSAMTTFKMKNIHSHDIGTFLANNGIAVRVGQHCAYPFHKTTGIKHSVRISLGIYNTEYEIEKVVDTIQRSIKYFLD